MAHIKTHTSRAGTVSYGVVWRVGGTRDGKWERESSDDAAAANASAIW
ncbi:hypothetical protein ACFYOY_32015 [Streptomyces sp. NPDC007875]